MAQAPSLKKGPCVSFFFFSPRSLGVKLWELFLFPPPFMALSEDERFAAYTARLPADPVDVHVTETQVAEPWGPDRAQYYDDDKLRRMRGGFFPRKTAHAGVAQIPSLMRPSDISRRSKGGVMLRYGDSVGPAAVPSLVKVWSASLSPTTAPGRDVLFPIQYDRHFGPLRAVAKDDVPFASKANRAVWRGLLTGLPRHRSRLALVERWGASASARVDVGLTGFQGNWDRAMYARFVKPPLPLRDMLRSKYLLSIEGNDVATNLKWCLASQSVVLMPPPTVVSWALEDRLEPWVHYVPLQPDTRDLGDKLRWCDTHQTRCAAIAAAATAFMRPFFDTAAERRLAQRVLRAYQSKVRIHLPPRRNVLDTAVTAGKRWWQTTGELVRRAGGGGPAWWWSQT